MPACTVVVGRIRIIIDGAGQAAAEEVGVNHQPGLRWPRNHAAKTKGYTSMGPGLDVLFSLLFFRVGPPGELFVAVTGLSKPGRGKFLEILQLGGTIDDHLVGRANEILS